VVALDAPGRFGERLEIQEPPPRRVMGDVEVARRLASILEIGAEKVKKAEADLAAGRITRELWSYRPLVATTQSDNPGGHFGL
jgi:hypothetical protein